MHGIFPRVNRAVSSAGARRVARAVATTTTTTTTAGPTDASSSAPRQHCDDGAPGAADDDDGGERWTVMGFATARRSDEMPLGTRARAIGEAFAPLVDAIAKSERARGAAATPTEVYVPDIPAFLCAARMARDSPYVRSVLVHDERKPRMKPRLSWYDATDASWVPRGWYEDGIKADLRYYFGEEDDASKRWT